jgi:hypothetical protein
VAKRLIMLDHFNNTSFSSHGVGQQPAPRHDFGSCPEGRAASFAST